MSYNSKDLKNYLEQNHYTFPVTEIAESDVATLGVKLFPTKFLLSPDKKFLILPHGKWEEYTKNYGLFEIEK